VLFIGFIDNDLLKLEHDFERVELGTLPDLTTGVTHLGEEVLRSARRRFVEYGGEHGSRGVRPYQYSAANMQAGVVSVGGPGGPKAISSVGQTLPRARIVEHQRPLWSQLQYTHGLKPATETDHPEVEMAEYLGETITKTLRRSGFTP